MELSLGTIIGQAGTFLVFILVTMKFVWPPLVQAMEERRQKIAEGLAQSEEAEKALDVAQAEADEVIREARRKAGDILEQASQRGTQIIEQAKQEAISERERQVRATEAEIIQAQNQARTALQKEAVELSVAGASKVLGREVKAADHEHLLQELIA